MDPLNLLVFVRATSITFQLFYIFFESKADKVLYYYLFGYVLKDKHDRQYAVFHSLFYRVFIFLLDSLAKVRGSLLSVFLLRGSIALEFLKHSSFSFLAKADIYCFFQDR